MSEVLRCMYAEDLKNKRVKMTIERVRKAPKQLYCNGQSTGAWDVIFKQKDKEGSTMYIQLPKPDSDGKRTAILRQFVMATGGDPCDGSVGKELTLYPIESKKSVTGQAMRIAIPEHMA